MAILRAVAEGQREIVLAGPAGSGKTTLMRQVLDDLQAMRLNVIPMAPTGKAALRLTQLTGRAAKTIHALIYTRCEETPDGDLHFGDVRLVGGQRTVLVCDEASMVGAKLHGDVLEALPPHATVLWVGDREQLPPVDDTWGPRFDSPTALLTSIHRQAEGSPIIHLATAVRSGQEWRGVLDADAGDRGKYRRASGTVQAAAKWLAAQRDLGKDATILCFSNKLRIACNDAVREARGHAGDVQAGDYLVCRKNAYFAKLWNGEVRRVLRVDGDTVYLEDGTGVLCKPATFGAGGSRDAWATAVKDMDYEDVAGLVKLEYGEALTVHAAQGSQWDAVCFVHDSTLDWYARKEPESYRRLIYTAVTRAAKELIIVEV